MSKMRNNLLQFFVVMGMETQISQFPYHIRKKAKTLHQSILEVS